MKSTIQSAVAVSALLLFAASVYAVWVLHAMSDARSVPPAGEEARRGAPKDRSFAADDAVAAVLQALRDQPNREARSTGGSHATTPTPPTAREALGADAQLLKILFERVQESLEQPGTHCLLWRFHDWRQLRLLATALAQDVGYAFLAGETARAIEILERAHLFNRIVSRGMEGSPRLIEKGVGAAAEVALDQSVAQALQRQLVSREQLSRLAVLYEKLMHRELPLDACLNHELGFLSRRVQEYDRRMGPLASLVRLMRGDGLKQVARIEAGRIAGEPFPTLSAMSGMHPMVALHAPDFATCDERYERHISLLHGVRAAIALEETRHREGHYPAVAPPDRPDPIHSRPFRLLQRDGRAILYGDGADSEDNGGDPVRDVVIWP